MLQIKCFGHSGNNKSWDPWNFTGDPRFTSPHYLLGSEGASPLPGGGDKNWAPRVHIITALPILLIARIWRKHVCSTLSWPVWGDLGGGRSPFQFLVQRLEAALTHYDKLKFKYIQSGTNTVWCSTSALLSSLHAQNLISWFDRTPICHDIQIQTRVCLLPSKPRF